jgi:hypothetical protein
VAPNEPISLKGMLFVTQQEVLREVAGADVYTRAVASLPAPLRERVTTTVAAEWVPFELVETVMVAVAEQAGRTPEALQREVAQRVADRLIRGVWRVIARFVSVEATVARAEMIWTKTYDRGAVRVEEAREGRARVVVSGVPGASEFMLRGFAYALEAWLARSRGRNPRVEWRRTDDGAVYTVQSRG